MSIQKHYYVYNVLQVHLDVLMLLLYQDVKVGIGQLVMQVLLQHVLNVV